MCIIKCTKDFFTDQIALACPCSQNDLRAKIIAQYQTFLCPCAEGMTRWVSISWDVSAHYKSRYPCVDHLLSQFLIVCVIVNSYQLMYQSSWGHCELISARVSASMAHMDRCASPDSLYLGACCKCSAIVFQSNSSHWFTMGESFYQLQVFFRYFWL